MHKTGTGQRVTVLKMPQSDLSFPLQPWLSETWWALSQSFQRFASKSRLKKSPSVESRFLRAQECVSCFKAVFVILPRLYEGTKGKRGGWISLFLPSLQSFCQSAILYYLSRSSKPRLHTSARPCPTCIIAAPDIHLGRSQNLLVMVQATPSSAYRHWLYTRATSLRIVESPW